MKRRNAAPDCTRVDDAVNHLLQQLRSEAPPDGMDARLVEALHTREANYAPLHVRRRRWVLCAAAASLGLLTAGLFCYQPHPRPEQRDAVQRSHALPELPAPQDASDSATAQPQTAIHTAALVRVRRAHRKEQMVPAYEAPSFPAPPEPPTHEEQLLVIVAKQNDPGNAALLNMRTQDKEVAWNRAAFAAYFHKPTEKEIESHAQQSE